MSRKVRILLMVLVVLGLGSFVVPSFTNEAHAGSNGQQLVFSKASGSQSIGISWIRIYGKNQKDESVAWYKEFNQLTTEYWLSNMWWKGQGTIEFCVTNSSGGCYYNICWIDVPQNMSSNWYRIEVDYGSNRKCNMHPN